MTTKYGFMIKTEQVEMKDALNLVEDYKKKRKERLELMKKVETKADKNRLKKLAEYARDQGNHYAALAKIHAAEIKQLRAIQNKKPRKRAKSEKRV